MSRFDRYRNRLLKIEQLAVNAIILYHRTMGRNEHGSDMLSKLTDKQRDAVSLLIEHKTSKEISRILAISPHTVDQRIESAKRKFGVSTRGELAQAYNQWLLTCQQMTYEESYITGSNKNVESSISDKPEHFLPMLDPIRSELHGSERSLVGYRVVHGLFDGPAGIWYRLIAIVAMAILLVITILGVISIFVELTEILNK
jgi:DNA-binding CsgD family transcriptional regulator